MNKIQIFFAACRSENIGIGYPRMSDQMMVVRNATRRVMWLERLHWIYKRDS